MEDNQPDTAAHANEIIEEAKRRGLIDPDPLKNLMKNIARMANNFPKQNFAVQACFNSYVTTVKECCNDKTKSQAFILNAGKLGYCAELPHLSNRGSIRDFIACVVHGMAIGAIPSAEGTRLLYGAQVAHSALPMQKRHKKRVESAQNASREQPLTSYTSVT